MTDYKALVRSLRICGDLGPRATCTGCVFKDKQTDAECITLLSRAAADAIEALCAGRKKNGKD